MRSIMTGLSLLTSLLVSPILAPLPAAAGEPPPAAPADCPASASPTPPGSGDSSAPVTAFPALPGGGFAAVNLGAAALNGTTCTPASPPLPKDVLRGDSDGNLLNDKGDAVLDGGGGGGGGSADRSGD